MDYLEEQRNEIEALGRLVDIASELEIGLAELARNLEGEAQQKAQRLTEISDGLADTMMAIYIELAKVEKAQEHARSTGAAN